MWELDHGEGWGLKNWCFWTVVLEKTLECSLDCKEIKPVNLKLNQPWMFIGRTDAEAEAPILWPPDAKNWLIAKDPDAGKDWGQKKGKTEDEMVGWHHRFEGHEFEYAPGVADGQRGLACCSPRGHKESDTNEWLNWTKLNTQPWCTPFPILNQSSVPCLVLLLFDQHTGFSVQFSSVTHSCPTLCDPMDCSMPDFPVYHQLPELTQTHVHWVGDAIQPSHPLLSLSPPALNLSQHQGLFQCQVFTSCGQILELQLHH